MLPLHLGALHPAEAAVMESVLNHVEVGILLAETDGTVSFVTPPVSRLLGVPLPSFVNERVAMLYGIPLCMVIALRGHWGEPYPWHTRGGIVTEGVLRALNIPFEYARSPETVGRQIREAYTFSQSSLSPVALLLTRDLMEEPL